MVPVSTLYSSIWYRTVPFKVGYREAAIWPINRFSSLERRRPARQDRTTRVGDAAGVLGAVIFEGDFLDINSVRRAAVGVSSIYFAYPVQDGLLDAIVATRLSG